MHPLLNPPTFNVALDRLDREEAENRGAEILNCGRMPCAPTDEIMVRGEDLQGFKNRGGLVGIIGIIGIIGVRREA